MTRPMHPLFLYSPHLNPKTSPIACHLCSFLPVLSPHLLHNPPYPTMSYSLSALPATASALDASLCYAPRMHIVPLPSVEPLHVSDSPGSSSSSSRLPSGSEKIALCRAPHMKTVPLPPVENALELEFLASESVSDIDNFASVNALRVHLGSEGMCGVC